LKGRERKKNPNGDSKAGLRKKDIQSLDLARMSEVKEKILENRKTGIIRKKIL
jgi:hypothetical protein